MTAFREIRIPNKRITMHPAKSSNSRLIVGDGFDSRRKNTSFKPSMECAPWPYPLPPPLPFPPPALFPEPEVEPPAPPVPTRPVFDDEAVDIDYFASVFYG